jgi:hypothetical protein
MITKELIDYIKNERKLGKNDEVIREALMKEGWNVSDLGEAFKELKSILPFTDFKKSKFSIILSVISILYVPIILYDFSKDTNNNFVFFIVIHLFLFLSSLFVIFTKNKKIYNFGSFFVYLFSVLVLVLYGLAYIIALFIFSFFGLNWN